MGRGLGQVRTRDLPQIVFKRGHRPWPWTPPARRSCNGCDGAPEGQDSAGKKGTADAHSRTPPANAAPTRTPPDIARADAHTASQRRRRRARHQPTPAPTRTQHASS
ncbi:hypothetical protein GUJ93_ZPchr0010g7239 [Zizania palustris]|uniref:Uncharacterized protein n=1 Tax=Zizania palustris TaxID=103762 RepID=A0A8J6BNL0_ZIZPA|nr:hypothetical protein GUJ93_ZPchr0010g7239 [Zizania palustris]